MSPAPAGRRSRPRRRSPPSRRRGSGTSRSCPRRRARSGRRSRPRATSKSMPRTASTAPYRFLRSRRGWRGVVRCRRRGAPGASASALPALLRPVAALHEDLAVRRHARLGEAHGPLELQLHADDLLDAVLPEVRVLGRERGLRVDPGDDRLHRRVGLGVEVDAGGWPALTRPICPSGTKPFILNKRKGEIRCNRQSIKNNGKSSSCSTRILIFTQ